MAANYHYVFLVLCLVCVAIGLYIFFNKGIQTSHFSQIAVRRTSETTLSTEVLIIGQYKTVGEGFFVGKRITISALLYLKDKQVYDSLKNLPDGGKFVAVENSEAPEAATRDISEAIRKGEANEAFTNPGHLRMVDFYDDKQTIVLEGDVIFTKEGHVTFGLPLSAILQNYQRTVEGISIAPSYVKHQIYTSRVVVLLTFIVMAIAFLSLFFGLHRNQAG